MTQDRTHTPDPNDTIVSDLPGAATAPIPRTPEDWHLFTGDEEEGEYARSVNAAHALHGALKRGIQKLNEMLGKGASLPAAINACLAVWHEAAEAHADTGACDSEPPDTAEYAVEEYLKRRGIWLR